MQTDDLTPLLVRPAPDEFPEYYERYVARVTAGDPIVALRQGIAETVRLLTSAEGFARAGHRYAPGKWTLAEVAGHMGDVERVMSFRALHLARGDETPLSAFDENSYTPAGRFDRLSPTRLARDLIAVRTATISLFETFPREAWDREGRVAGNRFTVRAFPYIIAGHELHHQRIIRDRYLA
jgi:hypothetical protein